MAYNISNGRCQEIARAAGLSTQMVADICTYDWREGQEHQDWLDAGEVAEIASWCAIIARDIESDPDRKS